MADVWKGENLSRGQHVFDKNLELKTLAAVTTTTAETGIAFDCRKIKEYAAIVYITACVSNDADETYVIDIKVSDVVGGTYTSIASVTVARGTTGVLVIPLHGATAELLDADSDFIQVVATLGGSTPSITYGAYLARASS